MKLYLFSSYAACDLCCAKFTNQKCLSIWSPIRPITFPMVNAANTVPIPSPLICPSISPVIQAVIVTQITSKETLTLEYFTFIISDSSRGNRSVGMIGRPHLLESAIPTDQQITECKSNQKTAQISRYKFFSQYHQT